jgi:hypothetical protein
VPTAMSGLEGSGASLPRVALFHPKDSKTYTKVGKMKRRPVFHDQNAMFAARTTTPRGSIFITAGRG